MTKFFRRMVCILLTTAMMVMLLPMQALAYYTDEESAGVPFVDSAGNTVSSDESWEDVFPYGTFAFANNQVDVLEGGEKQKITIYRLGGTTGRAEAYIKYEPALSEIDDGQIYYASAIGASDITIEVEDPMPIAQYQPLGKETPPEAAGFAAVIDEEKCTTDVFAEDGETVETYGDVFITLDMQADSYQWYTLVEGEWQIIDLATDAYLLVSNEHYPDYDFRCEYKIGGGKFCTDSVKGAVYEAPEEEILPELPEGGVELDPEITYSKIEMDEEFAGYAFKVVFAEDEWVKDILIDTVDDDIKEGEEFALFTIFDCEGGSLYDTANTLTLRLTDNEQAEPTDISFELSEVSIDKSSGTAELKVIRSGDTSYVASVDYTTLDGSATAGKDYAATSGTLSFYTDITELTISVPLFNDGQYSTAVKEFTVQLSGLKGGGEAESTINTPSISISLTNSGTADGVNILSVLNDNGNDTDISGSVDIAEDSATGASAETVTGTQVEDDFVETPIPITSGSSSSSSGGMSLETYDYADKIDFLTWRNTTPNYVDNYWVKYSAILGREDSLDYHATQITGRGNQVNDCEGYAANRTAMWQPNPGISKPYDDAYSAGWQFEYNLPLHEPRQGTSAYYPYLSKKYFSVWLNTARDTGVMYEEDEARLLNRAGIEMFGTQDIVERYDTTWSIWNDNFSWYIPFTADYNRIGLFVQREIVYGDYDDEGYINDPGIATIRNAMFWRRCFTSEAEFFLRIYTANDADTVAGYNIPEADFDRSKLTVLTESSGVYQSIKPTVTFKQNQGGVKEGTNQVYVGSTLKIELAQTPAYQPDVAGVWLVANDDSFSKQAVAGENGVYYIDLVWDDMTEEQLSKDYTICVIMNREQTIAVDVAPSVPREVVNGVVQSSIDTTKIEQTLNEFLSSEHTQAVAAYVNTNSATNFYGLGRRVGLDKASGTLIKSTFIVDNLHMINFGMPEEDVFVLNGRTYAGNEDIYLSTADMKTGTITFRYYSEESQSLPSVMTTAISSSALYLDSNGNGRIDGFFNQETGYFVLIDANERTALDPGFDVSSADRFIKYFAADEEVEETYFQPVGGCQYFIMTYYSKTPRSLAVPPGANGDEPAQVNPALITNITEPGVLAGMTEEKKGYRFVVSGMLRTYENNSVPRNADDYDYSSDNLLMYGAAASANTVVLFALGGDYSPPVIKSDGTGYDWSPDYRGQLLYEFTNPEPVTIPHSLAGENIAIAEPSGTENGKITYEESELIKINGYLGSFTADDTFAICAREQTEATGTIMNPTGMSMLADEIGHGFESSSIGCVSAFPNSDYLKLMDAGASAPSADFDMDDCDDFEFPEFGMDFGTELPAMKIGASDYVKIIVDGYQIGFTIGIPLKNNSEGGAKQTNKESMAAIKDFLSGDSSFADKGYSDAKNGGKTTSKKFSASLSFSMAFLYEYNPLDNDYYFKEFGVALSGQLSYKVEARFAPVPIVYVYISIGIKLTIGTGCTVERTVVEDTFRTTIVKALFDKNHSYDYESDSKAYNIYFKGALYVDNPNGLEGVTDGYIKSDDETKPVLVVLKEQDSYMLTPPITTQFTALFDNTYIDRIVPVSKAKTETYWNGITISPYAFLEAGVGVGVEVCKFELFAKANIGASMTIASQVPDEDGETNVFTFDSFKLSLGIGFRVVFLLFSYEMDLIGYNLKYDGASDEWSHSWTALGEEESMGTLSLESFGGSGGLNEPGNTAYTQTIYSPEDNGAGSSGGMSLEAVEATDAPFQMSGYGSTGDAYTLIDGINRGYDYQVVTVGDQNYIIYTISRSGDIASVDRSMLVMSKLELTGDTYGLVNPVTGTALPQEYVPLEDDSTGDLEFKAWVEGSSIYINYIDYAAATPNDSAYAALSAEQKMSSAAKNTTVSQVVFEVVDLDDDGVNDVSFTPAQKVSGEAGSTHIIPDGDFAGSAAFYGTANHYADASNAKEDFNAFIDTLYPPADNVSFAQNLKDMQANMYDLYGQSSSLNVSVMTASWQTHSEDLGEGELLDNAEFAYVETNGSDSIYYLAYTTSQNHYVGADGNVIADPDVDNIAADMATEKKLILRKITVAGDGTVTWGDANIIKKAVDFYNDGKTDDPDVFIPNCVDGFVNDDATITPQKDPYFGSLSFMEGKLDSQVSQQFLLFEMGTNTYYIDESNLDTIADGSGGEIVPFFEGAVNDDGEEGAVGKTNTTIGTDGQGNISAVYTSTVANTTNNALYITKYDETSGEWGDGNMLAMNHMQVYEDSIEQNWTPQETEQAYYGNRAGYSEGSMDSFEFTDLQIALGQSAPDEETLLVVASGDMTWLVEETYTDADGESNTIVIPGTPDPEPVDTKRGMGVYALSFGVGSGSVGQVQLGFGIADFSAGTELDVDLSFVNTGDIRIRASGDIEDENDTELATVKLLVEGRVLPLCEWKIDESVSVGQKVELSGIADELTDTIAPGSRFYITVEEGTYFASPFIYSTLNDGGNFTVGDYAELGFEDITFESTGIRADGATILDVDFTVGNRGTQTANGVGVQFSYQTGEQEDGTPVYSPLDISGHSLNAAEQTQMSLQAAVPSADNSGIGIYMLYSSEDSSSSINENYSRRVQGKLYVPAECYYEQGVGKTLNIRAEIFSNADTQTSVTGGLMVFDHAEYNSINNAGYACVEPKTYFSAADKITVALGSTMRLPVAMQTTTGKAPSITVTQMQDEAGLSEADHMGILYYSEVQGAVVITPSREGEGFIRVQDTATNSFFDIAYTVSGDGDGINIFNNNEIFSFFDAGTTVDNQTYETWDFKSPVPEWGTIGGPAPYLYDLSAAPKGAYFTFLTLSESLELFFEGEAKVTSSLAGSQTVSCTGGDNSVQIDFGSNPTYYPHLIKVEVLSETGQFDKVIESYANDAVPTPSDDAVSPQIYWSRTFPETASMLSGPVELTCYVIDDSGLAAVSFNGAQPENLIKNDDGFWQFDVSVNSNGSLSVFAVDTAGNNTKRDVVLDWFNDPMTEENIADAPTVDAWFEYEDGTRIESVVPTGTTAYIDYISSAPADAVLEETLVYRFNESIGVFEELTANGEDRYEVSSNGIYKVTAFEQDGNNGKQASKIIYMKYIDTSLPILSLGEAPVMLAAGADSGVPDRELNYSVSKGEDSLSVITDITINGQEIPFSVGQSYIFGAFELEYGGDYELYAQDEAGNSNTVSTTVSNMQINTGADDVFNVQNAWNHDENNGSITIDEGKITGGLYLESELNDNDIYKGVYEYAMCVADDMYEGDITGVGAGGFLGGLSWSGNLVYDELVPDTYVIYIRDAQEPSNQAVISQNEITVGSDLVVVTPIVTNITTLSGSDGQIRVETEGGSGELEYSLGGSIWQDGDTFTGLAQGSYSVYARDKANPLNVSIAAEAVVNYPGVVTITEGHTGVTLIGQNNGRIGITGHGGNGTYQYTIDGGATWYDENEFTGLPEGTYYLAARDKEDIPNVSEILEIELTKVDPVTISVSKRSASEFGARDGVITVRAAGGNGTYEYSKDGGNTWQDNASFYGLRAQSYKIAARDKEDLGNVCDIKTVTVAQPDEVFPAVTIKIKKTDAETIGANSGSITVNASGGSGPYEYSKDGGKTWQGSSTFAWLKAGEYSVLARDLNDVSNVSAVKTVTISEPDEVTLIVVQTSVSEAGGNDGSITVSALGGSGAYIYSIDSGDTWQDGDTFENLPIGIYLVTAQDKQDNKNTADVHKVTITESIADTGADGGASGDISGTLRDAGGNPLSGYKAVLFFEPVEQDTGSGGTFKFEGVSYTRRMLIITDESGKEIGRYELVFAEGETALGSTSGQTITITYTAQTAGVDISFTLNEDSGALSVSDITFAIDDEDIAAADAAGEEKNLWWLLWAGLSALLIAGLTVGWLFLKKRRAERNEVQ